MTSSVELSHAEFLRTEHKPEGFGDLVQDCLTGKGRLRMTMKQDHVEVDLLEGARVDPGVALWGHWSAPEFNALSATGVSAQLFMPFLFSVSRMEIHATQIAALDVHHRSPINFFVRNLFLAISRGCTIVCHDDPAEALPGTSGDFRLHYMYLFKHIFPEKAFEDIGASEVMDLLLCNSYLPLFDFENDLLKSGAVCLRNLAVSSRMPVPADVLKRDLLQTRDGMLAHF